MKAIIGTLLALLWMVPAASHTRSESHSAWTIDGRAVHIVFTVSVVEAAKLSRNGNPPSDSAMLAYLGARVGASAGGERCRPRTPPRTIAATAGHRRFEFAFACARGDAIELRSDAFFDEVPTHVNFAQIQASDGDFVEQLLTADARGVAVGAAGELEGAGFFRFVQMGIGHIVSGIDHIAFLIGLVLISRRLRDLAFVVTGFTIGHSLTLALAVTGVIRPQGEFIDTLVALTIALIGLENVAMASGRSGIVALWTGASLFLMGLLALAGWGGLPPLLLFGAGLFVANYLVVSARLQDAARFRLLVTLVFGLIHGFGFAGDLLESRLPAGRLAELLAGFNLGVELGQLAIVTIIWGVAWLIARTRLGMPRAVTVDVVAAGLVTVGTYWFVSRTFA